MVPKLLGDALLQLLDLSVREFDDFAGAHVDEMIVMLLRMLLIAQALAPKVMAIEDVNLLEHVHRAVDRGDTDPGVYLRGPAKNQIRIRMIG